MASKTIRARIFLHDQLVDTRSFAQDVIKLGRLTSSHVQLDDEAVARMHAVLELGPDGDARVVDLGSPGGTKLNGARIDRAVAVRAGDKLEIGPYRIELDIADAVELVSPARAVEPRHSGAATLDVSKLEIAGSQVAEVVASYQRSVLDVAHVGQTRSRKRQAVPLLAFGGVLMAGGLGLFAYEVAQPWDEYSAAAVEAQQLHRELPAAPGLGTGSLGLVLGLLGLVPMLGGAIRLRDESLEVYSIGEGDEANFKVSGALLPNPSATPLVARDGDGFSLAFTSAMDGVVDLGDQRVSLADLIASGRATAHAGGYSFPLPAHARAHVSHGDIRFDVSLVQRGAVVAGRGQVDWPFWSYFGGTATVATAFYMLMRAMPDDAMAIQLDDGSGEARYAAYFHQADNEVEIEAIADEPEVVASNEPAGGKAGSRAPGPEGQMGKPSSKNPSGAYQLKGPKDAIPALSRNYNPDLAARNAGILGILAAQDQHFLASVNGGAFAVGNDDADLWGQLVGTEAAEAYGTGGMGLIGSGHGGGGNANGLIGVGGTGLIGHGTGTDGLNYGPGDGTGGTAFGPKKPRTPVAHVGKGEIKGDIDKDLIRRIVRAHINEVRGCYNAGLSKNPNLEGRVTVQFSIVGNGKVSSSVVQENTTKDAGVANCIAKAVKRWQFPRVGNGGTALVSYPFRLTPG